MFEPTPYEMVLEARVPTGLGGRWYGVYPAIVSDNNDPDGQGRIKIMLPWSPDTGGERYEVWARFATLMGGDNRGTWFIPDVNDEVLVAFEAGQPHRPYVLGGLWNGKDKAPASVSGGKNNLKVIRSRNGVKITLDDTDGSETLKLETPGGQTVTLKDGPGSIELLDGNGNSVKLETSGITINASAKLSITASTIDVSAGQITVNSGMSSFSGVVKADTVIATTVVGGTYTPGAGNIW